jgi:hypothetical protein
MAESDGNWLDSESEIDRRGCTARVLRIRRRSTHRSNEGRRVSLGQYSFCATDERGYAGNATNKQLPEAYVSAGRGTVFLIRARRHCSAVHFFAKTLSGCKTAAQRIFVHVCKIAGQSLFFFCWLQNRRSGDFPSYWTSLTGRVAQPRAMIVSVFRTGGSDPKTKCGYRCRSL